MREKMSESVEAGGVHDEVGWLVAQRFKLGHKDGLNFLIDEITGGQKSTGRLGVTSVMYKEGMPSLSASNTGSSSL
jgi:hypothetical protein